MPATIDYMDHCVFDTISKVKTTVSVTRYVSVRLTVFSGEMDLDVVTAKSHSAEKSDSKKQHDAGKRSRRSRWTTSETHDFYKAVQKFGVGQWQVIAQHLKTSRSNMQLKDKWRTIVNTEYDDLSLKFGQVGI